MKLRYSYLWIIFLLLTSCSKEELLHEFEDLVPIRFSSLYVNITTKANNISQAALPSDIEISLFSLQHPLGSSAQLWHPKEFNNTIGITNINGNIIYDNTYYFPFGEQLDFFAIHPFISTGPTLVPTIMAPNQPPSPSKTTQPINTTSCMPLC